MDIDEKELPRRKTSEGKHFNVATSHVAKKLVRVIFSLLKNDSVFVE